MLNIFKKKKTIICEKCGGTMVEQTNASVISGMGTTKLYLYKCKKCKKEKIQ